MLVIDNSSAFRNWPEIPLIVPEINIAVGKGKKLIANPNCTTAIALMALWPIHQRFKIKKAIISTYQAASGAGFKFIFYTPMTAHPRKRIFCTWLIVDTLNFIRSCVRACIHTHKIPSSTPIDPFKVCNIYQTYLYIHASNHQPCS